MGGIVPSRNGGRDEGQNCRGIAACAVYDQHLGGRMAQGGSVQKTKVDIADTSSALMRYKVYEPILVVGQDKLANLDIRLRVKGGGHVSQLYALRQAIAKGVVAYVAVFFREDRVLMLVSTPRTRMPHLLWN